MKHTRTIKVGNVIIGPNHPIVIQSMTTTKPKNISETITAINNLSKIGAEIVRVAIEDLEDAAAISLIKPHINVPIVGDIHFDYKLGIAAIEAGADKIRINPGNILDIEGLHAIIEAAKSKNIPIRIGFNSGSISKIVNKKTEVDAILETVDHYIKMFESWDFYNFCISIKMSDPLLTITANERCFNKYDYPLHIGLTEAGDIISGTVRSSYVLGTLISKGIGDTIRVSLSAPPEKEIEVAEEILKMHNKIPGATLISCPTCGRTSYDMLRIIEELGPLIRNIKKNVKIAIMGCVVNGPGEAKDADIGIAGNKGKIMIFKKGKIIKTVDESKIKDILIEEIENL